MLNEFSQLGVAKYKSFLKLIQKWWFTGILRIKLAAKDGMFSVKSSYALVESVFGGLFLTKEKSVSQALMGLFCMGGYLDKNSDVNQQREEDRF